MQGMLGHYLHLIPERWSLGGHILSNIKTFLLFKLKTCVCVYVCPPPWCLLIPFYTEVTMSFKTHNYFFFI